MLDPYKMFGLSQKNILRYTARQQKQAYLFSTVMNLCNWQVINVQSLFLFLSFSRGDGKRMLSQLGRCHCHSVVDTCDRAHNQAKFVCGFAKFCNDENLIKQKEKC